MTWASLGVPGFGPAPHRYDLVYPDAPPMRASQQVRLHSRRAERGYEGLVTAPDLGHRLRSPGAPVRRHRSIEHAIWVRRSIRRMALA